MNLTQFKDSQPYLDKCIYCFLIASKHEASTIRARRVCAAPALTWWCTSGSYNQLKYQVYLSALATTWLPGCSCVDDAHLDVTSVDIHCPARPLVVSGSPHTNKILPRMVHGVLRFINYSTPEYRRVGTLLHVQIKWLLAFTVWNT